eukprot:1875073-Pyramimonas_sp.AAC.1
MLLALMREFAGACRTGGWAGSDGWAIQMEAINLLPTALARLPCSSASASASPSFRREAASSSGGASLSSSSTDTCEHVLAQLLTTVHHTSPEAVLFPLQYKVEGRAAAVGNGNSEEGEEGAAALRGVELAERSEREEVAEWPEEGLGPGGEVNLDARAAVVA